MNWKKFSGEQIEQNIQNKHPLFCSQSKVTGYTLCRGICCGKCNEYENCKFHNKCSQEDIDFCINDMPYTIFASIN